jgi:curved DNA-binding protein CbpA
MSEGTHYATLGLLPTTAPEVIRAAYKAHVLICHPDKTLHLAAGERASHSAAFNKVQAAYDVLGNPNFKAAYDAELSRWNNKRNVHSTPSAQSSSRAARVAAPETQCHRSVKPTTPEERIAMRAKARQSLESLRRRRTERNQEDADMDTAGLRILAQTWKQLAEDNRHDPTMHAHCAIRIQEYKRKIADREQQHEAWLEKMSTAKQGPATPASKLRQPTPETTRKSGSSYAASVPKHTSSPSSAHRVYPHVSPTRSSRDLARAEARKHIEAERDSEMARRAKDRIAEKAQREVKKQAQLEEKAAAVRAEKKKMRAKASLQAQQDAERITKARMKVGVAPLGTLSPATCDRSGNDVAGVALTVGRVISDGIQTKAKKTCTHCGVTHASFRGWRECNARTHPASQGDDGPFSNLL